MTTIAEIAGMDHRSATRLRRAGVKTAEALLDRADAPERLRSLSEQTGIDSESLTRLAATADLMRLDGIGGRYSALLKLAGIDSVAELARHSPEEALEALRAANYRARIVRRLPTPEDVRLWVEQASTFGGGVGPDSPVGGKA